MNMLAPLYTEIWLKFMMMAPLSFAHFHSFIHSVSLHFFSQFAFSHFSSMCACVRVCVREPVCIYYN